VASVGIMFVALKYKLDQANYHKDLFEERYAIFLKIDEIFSAYYQRKNHEMTWQDFKRELDSIDRKSHFLFGVETSQFIGEFREAIIYLTSLEDRERTNDPSIEQKLTEARKFLDNLLDGQSLSDKFLELKIDSY